MAKSIQMKLFTDQKQLDAQRALLEDLIELKYNQIFERACRNFWGTAEACGVKKAEVDTKAQRFRDKVERAFPEIMTKGL